MREIAPPQDKEIEEIVLGTLLSDREALQDNVGIMFEELFYQDNSRIIYRALIDLMSQNMHTDITSVVTYLKQRNTLETVGGAFYVSQLTNQNAYGKVEYYIRILTQLLLKRRQLDMADQIVREAADKSFDVFESIDNVEKNLDKMNNFVIGADADYDIAKDVDETYTELITPRSEKMIGIPTGSPELNSIMGGWQRGDFIILAGRPSHGKSTRAVQFLIHASFENYKCAFFSIEVKKKRIIEKMLSNVSAVELNTIRKQKWNQQQIDSYQASKDRLRNTGMLLNDESSITPKKLLTICRERKRKYGLDIVIVDYLQIMKPNPDKGYRSREQEISSISWELKSMAKELNVPVIALSQLSRECDKRPNKRPQLGDLRDSGSIEQDADIVLSTYVPSKYYEYGDDRDYFGKEGMDEENYALASELGILKHRNGASGFSIKEKFHKDRAFFE